MTSLGQEVSGVVDEVMTFVIECNKKRHQLRCSPKYCIQNDTDLMKIPTNHIVVWISRTNKDSALIQLGLGVTHMYDS